MVGCKAVFVESYGNDPELGDGSTMTWCLKHAINTS